MIQMGKNIFMFFFKSKELVDDGGSGTIDNLITAPGLVIGEIYYVLC